MVHISQLKLLLVYDLRLICSIFFICGNFEASILFSIYVNELMNITELSGLCCVILKIITNSKFVSGLYSVESNLSLV
jgi:hypothetical protein